MESIYKKTKKHLINIAHIFSLKNYWRNYQIKIELIAIYVLCNIEILPMATAFQW